MSARPEVIVPPAREGSARDVVEVPTDAETIATLRERLSEVIDNLRGYQDLVSRQREKIAQLEAQVASLTLDRDAARELLDAETARLEAKVSRLKRAVVALGETLFEELRP